MHAGREKPSLHLGMVWGRSNRLLVYPTYFNDKNQASPSRDFKPHDDSILQEVSWETVLFNRVTRRLANDSNGIFQALQKINKEQSTVSLKQQQLKISQKYRSVLKATVDNLQTAADDATDESVKEFYELQSQGFYKMELVWNLCEILFIDAQPGGMVMVQLLDWIRWHFNDGDTYAKEAMTTDPPDSHPQYWDALIIYIFQGRINNARKLLRLHTNHTADAFQQLDTLLKKMPVFVGPTGHSVPEFDLQWKHWQEECRWKLQEEAFQSNPNLEFICRIFCGEKQAFHEKIELFETWYHLLVSRLLYSKPTVKPLEIQYLAEECLEVFNCLPKPSQLDSILLAAIEYDPFRVIKESSVCFDTWWFAAHLTDLLFHCNKLNSDELSYSTSLREFLLLDYVASLMSHESLWQVGADYLNHCPTYGKQHLEQYLERIPIKTEATALKLLYIAQSKDLPSVAQTICRTMGMNALRNKNLGSAMTWALKSKDSAFATYLANKFLTEYSETGEFTTLDLLENLGSAIIVSDQLTFLAKYQEFHKVYAEGEFQNAATLLTSLLTSRLAPKFFWMTLLIDALPLLEAEKVIFSTEQTYELMYSLQVLQEEKGKESQKNVSHEDKEELIRLALSRNLARAIILEGTEI